MKKVFVLPAQEQWVCDAMADCFIRHNPDVVTLDPNDADVLWLLSDWRWRLLPIDLLQRKRVLCTVHHIVPDKQDKAWWQDFWARDRIVDVYQTFNDRATTALVSTGTNRPIEQLPYWVDQLTWKHRRSLPPTADLRKKFGLRDDAFIILSAQRDTEGHDLKTGKWEKGPDLLAAFVERTWETRKDLHVVLAGWRRQYVIDRLTRAHVPFTYFERPSQAALNELYACADLYPVCSRYEGGPAALLEAGCVGLPVVSRPVGIAEQVLPSSAIHDDVSLATPAVPDVSQMLVPYAFGPYLKLLHEMAREPGASGMTAKPSLAGGR